MRLRRIDPGLPVPARAHDDDAAVDLMAAEDVELAPGARALVATGIAIALPPDHVGLVHPRSGLAARHGVTVLNAPGTIDAGYRGEIKVNLVNLDPERSFSVHRGNRIAQLLVQRVERVEWEEVPEHAWEVSTERGESGHGASGGFADGGRATDGKD